MSKYRDFEAIIDAAGHRHPLVVMYEALRGGPTAARRAANEGLGSNYTRQCWGSFKAQRRPPPRRLQAFIRKELIEAYYPQLAEDIILMLGLDTEIGESGLDLL